MSYAHLHLHTHFSLLDGANKIGDLMKRVARLGMPKVMYVSTAALFFGAMNVMKVIPYFALGQFTAPGLATSAALLPLAMAANAFGFWVVRRTPDRVFFQVTLALLFLISLALLWQGGRGLLGI